MSNIVKNVNKLSFLVAGLLLLLNTSACGCKNKDKVDEKVAVSAKLTTQKDNLANVGDFAELTLVVTEGLADLMNSKIKVTDGKGKFKGKNDTELDGMTLKDALSESVTELKNKQPYKINVKAAVKDVKTTTIKFEMKNKKGTLTTVSVVKE